MGNKQEEERTSPTAASFYYPLDYLQASTPLSKFAVALPRWETYGAFTFAPHLIVNAAITNVNNWEGYRGGFGFSSRLLGNLISRYSKSKSTSKDSSSSSRR